MNTPLLSPTTTIRPAASDATPDTTPPAPLIKNGKGPGTWTVSCPVPLNRTSGVRSVGSSRATAKSYSVADGSGAGTWTLPATTTRPDGSRVIADASDQAPKSTTPSARTARVVASSRRAAMSVPDGSPTDPATNS